MKKSEIKKYPRGTSEYVVKHAEWQRSRGRRPSEAFPFRRNPIKALAFAESFAYFPAGGVYLRGLVPENYQCTDCNEKNIKLWRESNTFSPKLLCAICAAKSQKKDISSIDADGRRNNDIGGRTDQIGWFVPAIPLEVMNGFWSYTSVPTPGIAWWRNLPTLPKSLELHELKEKQFVVLTISECGTGSFTDLKGVKSGQREVYFIDRIGTGALTEATMLLGQLLVEFEGCPGEAIPMRPGGTNRIYFPRDKRIERYYNLTNKEKDEARNRLNALSLRRPDHKDAIDNLIQYL